MRQPMIVGRLIRHGGLAPLGAGGGIKVMDPDQGNGGANKIIFPADLNQVAVLYW